MEQENIEIEDVKIFLDESNRSVQISNLILEDNNVFTFYRIFLKQQEKKLQRRHLSLDV